MGQNVFVDENALSAIAGAIREKNGTDDTYTPREMAAAIRQMTGGVSFSYAAVGTVIFHAGLTAPAGYLVCDGAVYGIAEYPDLAHFFAMNYGSANYWGGDGVTTFAVPDWQGEFFRAAGTNSRSGQGSGAAVGVHQNATGMAYIGLAPDQNTWFASGGKTASDTIYPTDTDGTSGTGTLYGLDINASETNPAQTGPEIYTARPTNTSLLVCMKAQRVDNTAEVVEAVLAALPDGEEMAF